MQDRATATLSTLLVDDEPLACEELGLPAQGFPRNRSRRHRANGLEAVDLIQKLEPDLVFLDVQMPGLDGMGVIRQLREKQASRCPISSW